MRFRVLGPVAADNDRGPVPLGAARQRTVLAVLLIEPAGMVSADQLVDRVWGADAPPRARQTLHTYLSRLRGLLADAGGPVLSRRSQSYRLDVEASAVDLHQFRALSARARQAADDEGAAALWRAALELWRGAPFADVESDWLRGVGEGLEAERFAAELDRNDVSLRRGEHARLLPELSAAATEHPLDERLAGQLMVAWYRCGRQTDALTHYRLLCQRLVDEFGSDPGTALRDLHQRILRQDPLLDVAAGPVVAGRSAEAEAAPAGAPAAVPAQLPADVAGFAGRAAPLRQLDALLGAVDDPPSTVLITAIGGSAGIGKTSLAVH